eukprot:TRINITY_DN30550_c0_g1_i1.p2 TRINITY_DN30550_c0_g1~~TRINITY_DN30550_c0_g1_i1.p2  ORF type:complete len:295 (+),score=21.75 TRINITY_DN30550_c0_g1_i1:37-921(+)
MTRIQFSKVEIRVYSTNRYDTNAFLVFNPCLLPYLYSLPVQAKILQWDQGQKAAWQTYIKETPIFGAEYYSEGFVQFVLDVLENALPLDHVDADPTTLVISVGHAKMQHYLIPPRNLFDAVKAGASTYEIGDHCVAGRIYQARKEKKATYMLGDTTLSYRLLMKRLDRLEASDEEPTAFSGLCCGGCVISAVVKALVMHEDINKVDKVYSEIDTTDIPARWKWTPSLFHQALATALHSPEHIPAEEQAVEWFELLNVVHTVFDRVVADRVADMEVEVKGGVSAATMLQLCLKLQ